MGVHSSDHDEFPETIYVIEFSQQANETTVAWLFNKIVTYKKEGGAELLLAREPSWDKGLRVHVTACSERMLEIADELELRKRDLKGRLRDFSSEVLSDFLQPGQAWEELLSSVEKQRIVRHELDNIRAKTEDRYPPGTSGIRLYQGQSIIDKFVHEGLISKIYPVHEPELLKKLGFSWYAGALTFLNQPLEEIRDYFGEALAFYCSFLGFYTTALFVPACLGLLQILWEPTTLNEEIFFVLGHILWATIFLAVWRRRSNEQAFTWGTLTPSTYGEPRAGYRGRLREDPVTGHLEPYYAHWKTLLKLYFVSVPIVLLCLWICFWVMLAAFLAEDLIRPWCEEAFLGWVWIQIPGVTYAALIWISNHLYRRLATFLTEWENHRTESQFERNRVTKLILFEFSNNFMALFYIAFYLQDMAYLRSQVALMLIVFQAINHFSEALLPLICRHISQQFCSNKSPVNAKSGVRCPQWENLQVPVLKEDDYRVKQALWEAELDSYEGTHEDYLELFIQFCYVFFFVIIYPPAAIWALLNNVIEIKADAFKFCRVLRRPPAFRVKNIGAWQTALQAVCAASVLTNCGLLAMSPLWHPDTVFSDRLLFCVILEHVVLMTQAILTLLIPPLPAPVRVAMAKSDYLAREALKQKRALELKNRPSRRCQSNHSAPKLDQQ